MTVKSFGSFVLSVGMILASSPLTLSVIREGVFPLVHEGDIVKNKMKNKHRDTEFGKGREKFLVFSFILRDSVPLWFF
ncbi:MAG: hypothetical protein QG641_1597 [Candidatus Poribacteria bacterium]|nr:hypothetical protein [Candidatus Poribacteria bacterium]